MKILIDKIKLNSEVSAHLAFILLLVLSFFTALYTIKMGNKILADMKEVNATRIDKEMKER